MPIIKILKIAFLTILSLTVRQSSEAQTNTDLNGLDHYWPFDNNLNDVIGDKNGMNGLGYNYTDDRFNRPQSSIYFTHGTIYIPTLFINKHFTISLWMKLSNYHSVLGDVVYSELLEFGDNSTKLAVSLAPKGVIPGQENSYQYNGTVSVPLTVSLFVSGSLLAVRHTSRNLEPGIWEHLTITMSSTKVFIYLNGTKEAEIDVPGHSIEKFQANSNYLGYRGHFWGLGGWQKIGMMSMDELKIFNRDLNHDEVLINMNSQYLYDSCTSRLIEICGENETPRRGICMDGACLCLKSWSGEHCNELIVKPRFYSTDIEVTVNEFEDFSFEIELIEGTQPLFYTIVDRTSSGIQVKKKAVYWRNVTSEREANYVVVKVANSLGSAEIRLRIRVNAVYFVEMSQLAVIDYLQRQSVLISGVVKSISSKEILKRSVNFNLFIQSSNHSIKRQLQTTKDGVFFYRYEISSREFGRCIADAKHPFDKSNINAQIGWNVLGLELDEITVIFSGFSDQIYTRKLRLSNPNSIKISLIRLIFEASSAYSLEVNDCQQSECVLSNQLNPGDSIDLNVSFRTKLTLNGRIAIGVFTQENVSTTFYLNVNIVEKKARLAAIPEDISFRVKPNQKMFFDFELSNRGLLNANNLTVQFSNSSAKFEVVSMTSKNNKNTLLDPKRFNLLINESIEVTFSAHLKTDFDATVNNNNNNKEAAISIFSLTDSLKIPIHYVISSFGASSLTVAVEDEFSYFGDEKPKLANAFVTLSNGNTFKVRQTTNATGYVKFENLTENFYELFVEADRHSSKKLVWQPIREENYLSVFLERSTVSVIFTVVPRLVDDKYDIILESVFEVNVPAPVVTVDPMYIDLEKLKTGLIDAFTLNITNHGLIKANGLEISLPKLNNIELEFETPIDMPFDLPAKTSFLVVIKVTVVKKSQNNSPAEMIRRRSRGLYDDPCSYTILVTYYYECSTRISRTIAIYLKDVCGENAKIDFNHHVTIGGFHPTPSEKMWHMSVQNYLGECDASNNDNNDPNKHRPPCSRKIYDCWHSTASNILSEIFRKNLGNCMSTAFNVGYCTVSYIKNEPAGKCIFDNIAMPLIYCTSEVMQLYLFGFSRLFTLLKPIISNFNTVFQCIEGLTDSCLKPILPSKKQRRSIESINIYSPFLYKHDLAPVFAESLLAIKNLYEMMIETYGEGYELIDESVIDLLNQFQLDSSDGGKYISENEYKQLENVTNPNRLKHFIERLNNTLILSDLISNASLNITNYMKMTLLKVKNDRYKSDVKRANQYGFDSIFTWFEETAKAFDRAPIKQGVCAKVLIRLSQQLVLTREVFEAELQMINSEAVDLTDVSILLNVRRANDSVAVNSDYFHQSDPILSVFSSIDGKGVLKAGGRGEAKWLLTPSKLAAPTQPADYIVDGYVKYRLNNVDLKIDLSEEKITVKPDPSLILFYFLEKHVQSDDPLTTVVEPTIPFVLGLLVVNNGYGVAKNLRIQTSQPEIVDNESGLLIDFNITSFYLNNALEASSLNTFFGDVQPFEVAHAIWWLESSLKGRFSRLNATLVNEDRNGNKQLSLVDRVEYKELIKTVRLFGEMHDDLVDFLVIDDNTGYVVYPSNQSLSTIDVVFISNATIIVDLSKSSIRLKLELPKSSWYLTQLKLTANLNSYYVLDTKRNGNGLLPSENVWLNQFNDENTWIVSLFDYNGDGSIPVEYDIELTRNFNLLTTKARLEATSSDYFSTASDFNEFMTSTKPEKIETDLIQSSVKSVSLILNKIWIYLLGITLAICLICLVSVIVVFCKDRKGEKRPREERVDPREQRKLIS